MSTRLPRMRLGRSLADAVWIKEVSRDRCVFCIFAGFEPRVSAGVHKLLERSQSVYRGSNNTEDTIGMELVYSDTTECRTVLTILEKY